MQSGWKSGFTSHKPGGGHGPQGPPLQSVPKSEQLQASVVVVVVQSGWKSGFTLHNPGGGHGPQGSPLQLVPKLEQLQTSVVEVDVVA